MRKFIICLIGAIILSNCEIRMKESHAQSTSGYISVEHYTIDGMDYAAFTIKDGSKVGIAVANVTRDKLQCEIMQINIDKAKKEKDAKR